MKRQRRISAFIVIILVVKTWLDIQVGILKLKIELMIGGERKIVIFIISYNTVVCISVSKEICTNSVIHYRVVSMLNLRISTKFILTTACIYIIV